MMGHNAATKVGVGGDLRRWEEACVRGAGGKQVIKRNVSAEPDGSQFQSPEERLECGRVLLGCWRLGDFRFLLWPSLFPRDIQQIASHLLSYFLRYEQIPGLGRRLRTLSTGAASLHAMPGISLEGLDFSSHAGRGLLGQAYSWAGLQRGRVELGPGHPRSLPSGEWPSCLPGPSGLCEHEV